MPDKQKTSTSIDSQYRILLVLWFGFLSSIVMYLLVSLALFRLEGIENRSLNIFFSAGSAFLVVMSFAVKKSFLSRAEKEQQLSLVKSGFVLAAALCEAGAILGLLDLFVGRNQYYFVLIIFSFLGLLFHVPKRSHLESAIYRLPRNSSQLNQE
jgi:hypothetical protein